MSKITTKQEMLNRILVKCTKYGAIPNFSTYKDKFTDFWFICSCGKYHHTKWNNARRERQHLICDECSNKRRTNGDGNTQKFVQSEVVNIFKEYGATLIDTYIDRRKPLKYSCSDCGRVNEKGLSLNQIRSTIVCKSCSDLYEEGLLVHKSIFHQKMREYFNEAIIPLFEKHHVELLTSLNDYIKEGQDTRLYYKCPACQTLVHRSWVSIRKSSIVDKNYDSPLLCFSCSRQQKTNNHPNQIAYERQRLHSRCLREWAPRIRELFGNRCIITGESGKLTAHHLNSLSSNREEAFDLYNGVLLTPKIHSEFHKKFGYGNNTEDQFRRFYLEKTKKILNIKDLYVRDIRELD